MASQTPNFIALGNFDGIHRGHRRVIDPILRSPTILSTPGATTTAVVSFDPHPQAFFTGQQRLLLTPLAEKRTYLRSIGVDDLILLSFDAQMAKLTPKQFVDTILVQQLQSQFISVGQNFRFGHRRTGTAQALQQLAAAWGIPVHITPLSCCEGDRISSSAIRHALADGDIETANRLLGRPYSLIGSIVYGQQLGRQIGFPTANLALPEDKFLPHHGVYAVHVILANDISDATISGNLTSGNNGGSPHVPISSCPYCIPGVMNIGYRPTVNGMQRTVEVHLLSWSGNLYGQTIIVQLQEFIRPEQKFDGLDALKNQISQDCDRARSLLQSSLSS